MSLTELAPNILLVVATFAASVLGGIVGCHVAFHMLGIRIIEKPTNDSR